MQKLSCKEKLCLVDNAGVCLGTDPAVKARPLHAAPGASSESRWLEVSGERSPCEGPARLILIVLRIIKLDQEHDQRSVSIMILTITLVRLYVVKLRGFLL
jgi:hypothetical protein